MSRSISLMARLGWATPSCEGKDGGIRCVFEGLRRRAGEIGGPVALAEWWESAPPVRQN